MMHVEIFKRRAGLGYHFGLLVIYLMLFKTVIRTTKELKNKPF